jgi:hypothetical protein
MDHDVLMFAQVMAVLVPSFVVVAATIVVSIRAISRSRLPPAPRPSRIDDDRFERLEQAVDSIAIEVERISESQRFAVKLLAERNADAAPEAGSSPHASGQ